ncbi:hypothetical protein [Corynebacterium silvaticum]|uniref:Uncharacterized protein n=2 Tax=Corynebacterium silvaticum TaxID=2320431 RepID=A0ACD4PZM9_9CORY|nr:hypothetical protein [Corynebacterium silvaticum]WCV10618.1 hypothetical protein CBE74_10530 [Corynebacterium silvaticum]
MKIRDLRQSIVIIVLFAAMWIVPVAVEKLAEPEYFAPVQGGKVTLEAGESRVELRVSDGFNQVISSRDSRASLVKGDSRLSFHLASGAENQERSIERALVLVKRQYGPAKWREDIRVAGVVNDSGTRHDLVGKSCEIE